MSVEHQFPATSWKTFERTRLVIRCLHQFFGAITCSEKYTNLRRPKKACSMMLLRSSVSRTLLPDTSSSTGASYCLLLLLRPGRWLLLGIFQLLILGIFFFSFASNYLVLYQNVLVHYPIIWFLARTSMVPLWQFPRLHKAAKSLAQIHEHLLWKDFFDKDTKIAKEVVLPQTSQGEQHFFCKWNQALLGTRTFPSVFTLIVQQSGAWAVFWKLELK